MLEPTTTGVVIAGAAGASGADGITLIPTLLAGPPPTSACVLFTVACAAACNAVLPGGDEGAAAYNAVLPGGDEGATVSPSVPSPPLECRLTSALPTNALATGVSLAVLFSFFAHRAIVATGVLWPACYTGGE